jgi:hypothetical protein
MARHDSKDRTAVRESWDKSAAAAARQLGQDSRDRTAGQDSQDRVAGRGHLGQDIRDRTAREDSRENISRHKREDRTTRHWQQGQVSWDRAAGNWTTVAGEPLQNCRHRTAETDILDKLARQITLDRTKSTGLQDVTARTGQCTLSGNVNFRENSICSRNCLRKRKFLVTFLYENIWKTNKFLPYIFPGTKFREFCLTKIIKAIFISIMLTGRPKSRNFLFYSM